MITTISKGAISANDVTAAVAVVSAIVALAALIKALMEYTQQGRQKRAEHFFELGENSRTAMSLREWLG